jgi:hypothetical protein
MALNLRTWPDDLHKKLKTIADINGMVWEGQRKSILAHLTVSIFSHLLIEVGNLRLLTLTLTIIGKIHNCNTLYLFIIIDRMTDYAK